MAYYDICKSCGGSLDPGEQCNCSIERTSVIPAEIGSEYDPYNQIEERETRVRPAPVSKACPLMVNGNGECMEACAWRIGENCSVYHIARGIHTGFSELIDSLDYYK